MSIGSLIEQQIAHVFQYIGFLRFIKQNKWAKYIYFIVFTGGLPNTGLLNDIWTFIPIDYSKLTIPTLA
jgi:hypothetical protein